MTSGERALDARPAADVVSESPTAAETPEGSPSGEASPTADASPTSMPSPSATATPTPTPTPTVVATPIRINFQSSGSPLVCGYAPDYGDVYAARNGQTYGWNYSHTSGTRDRGRMTDQLLDTLAHFGSGGNWEIAVPNGQHEVKVGIGDSEHSSNHTINVEGVNYWNNTWLNRWQFVQQSKTVTVSDGKLTIDQGTLGSGKTHINYLEIDSSGTIASCAPVAGATPTVSPSTSTVPSPSWSASPSPSVSRSASPTPTPTPTPTEPTGPEMRVNFQLAGSPTVCDYAPDTGAVFGHKTDALSYGWNFDHSDMTRDRNLNPDQRLDTLAHFRRGGVWEIAVQDGLHEVTISIGDAGYSSTHYLFVEGVPFWNGVRLGRNEFVQTTKDVIVADGRLTITQGNAGDYATRINYIEIDPDGVPPVCPKPTPTPTPTPTKASPSPSPTRPASPSPTPSSLEPLPLRSRAVRVNFQSWGSKRVCGYDPDFGGSYDQRSGAVYGWNFDHSDVMRDRDLVTEQRLDTLAHFHSGGEWEIKLRNGQHRVTVGIGDPGYESTHTLNVEGNGFWRSVHLNEGAFRQMTRTVTVRDGKLSLNQGNAPDKSTRIQFLTINVDGPPEGCDGSTQPKPAPDKPKAPADSTTGGGGSVGPRPYGLSGLVRVFGKRCNGKANDARTWYPSTAGRGKEGYVYYHSKLARKVGGKVLGGLNRKHMRGAVDYGVWGYSCRIKRGGTSWSVHSWGVAIDTNTLRNPWQATRWNGRGANGKDYGKRYPRLWLNQNFYWGINFRDPMHFQYVSGY
jgi:hypothetical protein